MEEGADHYHSVPGSNVERWDERKATAFECMTKLTLHRARSLMHPTSPWRKD